MDSTGGSMFKRSLFCVLVCLAFSFLAVYGQERGPAQRGGRGAPEPPRPDNHKSLAHLDAAKKIAGNDSFLANPLDFFCVPGKARAQNNAAPALEPSKLFDNIYEFRI